MNIPHLKTKIGEYALIVNSKQEVLMVQLHEPAQWHFPGGRLDEGEASIEGLLREIREEVGLTVTDIYPVYTTIFTDENKYGVFFVAQVVEPCNVKLSDEHQNYCWVSSQNIDQIDFWQPFYRELIEKHVFKK